MTSLIAWIGADSHGPSSAYFASDSRITWGGVNAWDHGRKLFGCRRYPHIFAYCGDALFPTQTLSQITELIDADLLLKPADDFDCCTKQIVSTLASAFDTYPAAFKKRFDVLYCMRESDAVPSQFHMKQITFDPLRGPQISSIPIPTHSMTVAVLGTGRPLVQAHLEKWMASDVGGTSRAVFSAFCDALRSGTDRFSAGPPQLMGFWRKSVAKTFGIIWQQRRYFYGTEVGAPTSLNDVRWYNELFEICDPATLELNAGAQRQPRPKWL